MQETSCCIAVMMCSCGMNVCRKVKLDDLPRPLSGGIPNNNNQYITYNVHVQHTTRRTHTTKKIQCNSYIQLNVGPLLINLPPPGATRSQGPVVPPKSSNFGPPLSIWKSNGHRSNFKEIMPFALKLKTEF